jgi:hypothetical protein
MCYILVCFLKYCGIFAQSKNCGARRDSLSRERLCKHIFPAAMKEHETMEEIFTAVFFVRSVPMLYKESEFSPGANSWSQQ